MSVFSLTFFHFFLFFLRLSWSSDSELLYRKLRVCLGTSGLAAGNLEHWETHNPQVLLLYYHPAGQSSFQRAQCSAWVLQLSVVSRSELRISQFWPLKPIHNLISYISCIYLYTVSYHVCAYICICIPILFNIVIFDCKLSCITYSLCLITWKRKRSAIWISILFWLRDPTATMSYKILQTLSLVPLKPMPATAVLPRQNSSLSPLLA